MNIRIVWPGRTKQKYLDEGIGMYLKRIGQMADVKVKEVKEQKGADAVASLKKEGERLLKQVGSYILMDESGRGLDSREFALVLDSRSSVEFVLGGAYGVSSDVKEKAADVISLSPMTLTHEMARLLLVEQIYRALMINAGRGYHH